MTSRSKALLGPALCAAILAAALPAAAQADPLDDKVDTARVFLHGAGGTPWSEDDPFIAMDTAFGAGTWDEESFESVDTSADANGLFAPSVKFIYADGGDQSANEFEAFLTANEAKLREFVRGGGALIVNAAPNEGDGMSYDGRQIVYADTSSEAVTAADPSHAIFQGPQAPVDTSYTGSSFGHALVTGDGLEPLILRTVDNSPETEGDPDSVVLAEYCDERGITLLGGMTMPGFQQPVDGTMDESAPANLLANILTYADGAGRESCDPTPEPEPTPEQQLAPQQPAQQQPAPQQPAQQQPAPQQPAPQQPAPPADPLTFVDIATAAGTTTVSSKGVVTIPGLTAVCGVGPCSTYERLFTAKSSSAKSANHNGDRRHGLLGRDRDTLGAGARDGVRVRLSKAALRKLRREGKLRVEALVTVTDAKGNGTTTRRTFTVKPRARTSAQA